jgi:AbrB family looped-hinge helix DNA binding protein
MSYETVSKVIKDYRLTIPKEIREVAGIEIGDYVKITIEKIEKTSPVKA